jgi:hypothetical protein
MPLTKIQSLGITDGTIVNADINASAAIASTKLSGTSKILQVITGTDSTARTSTSGTLATNSNTLSVSITPSSVSSKIFVIVTTVAGQNTAGRSAKFSLYRDSTSINYFQCNDQSDTLYYPLCISNLDSPATTSAITYQLYFATDGVGTTTINSGTSKGSITAFEIGA